MPVGETASLTRATEKATPQQKRKSSDKQKPPKSGWKLRGLLPFSLIFLSMSGRRQKIEDQSRKTSGGFLELLGLKLSDNSFANEALDHRVFAMRPVWATLLVAILPTAFLLSRPVMAGQVRWIPVMLLALAPFVAWLIGRTKAILGLQPHLRAGLSALGAGLMGYFMSFVISDVAPLPMGEPVLMILGATMMVMIAGFSRLHASMLAFPIGLLLHGPIVEKGVMSFGFSIGLFLCMAILAVRQARSEFEANADRSKANDRATRSNRLLDEFEQHSPGWFWETDKQGLISYISPKLCDWLVGDAGRTGQPLTTISKSQSDGSVGERTLGFYLSSRTPFADLPVQAATGDEERWWSVSGRPVIDKYGQFRGFIGTGTDLTEKRRSEAEVEKLARFDSLTGLANRAEIGNILRRAIPNNHGQARPAGLMMLDLDRFKAVNDTLGHPVGDQLLQLVAMRLSQAVGSLGQVGRLGGDEFQIVFPGADDRQQLAALAEAMIESLSKPYFINAAAVSIGASIGIAIAPTDGTTGEELVRNADLALYAAKGAGRGVACFYDANMLTVAEQKRLIENDMRKALANGEFRMVYQPVVSLENEKIIGFEALIRWNHPTRGPISPADFIPVAEENGLIEQIGEWALRTAAGEAASWAVNARVAVNVSTIQFQNPKFPGVVASVLAQSGLENERLELEITESVFVADTSATDHQFGLLKKLGIRLALDDFGTGYSSLGYLKRAPFDKIKIDQSFVRGASLGQDKNAAIIKAIVTLAQTMHMETTAEGVETQDEIDFIRELGCSHIQGFVYGKPIEAADLRERLGTRGNIADRIGHKATREPRMRVFRVSQLDINGRQHPVRMRNISNGGAMVEGPDWVVEGTPVAVDITDSVTVDGIVKWVDEGHFGIQFSQRIDLNKVVSQVLKTGSNG